MAAQQKKVTKSRGRSRGRGAGGSKGQSKLKKKTGRTRMANRTTKKTSRSQQSTAKNLPDRYEAPAIEDSGAVKEARSSVENIVEDAQEKVEKTTGPAS